jgi:hypothetical protein
MTALRKWNIPRLFEPLMEYQDANDLLKEGDSVRNTFLMFSDVPKTFYTCISHCI